MKNRWYTNWLIVITIGLFLSSLTLFVLSLKDSVGFTKCAYGEDMEENCVCTSDGKKVCDESALEKEILKSDEFISSGLIYSYDFVDYIDASNRVNSSVNFTDISYLGGGLKVTLELRGFCDEDGLVASQIGLYKIEDERLIFTVGSNIADDSFSLPCLVESNFFVGNFSKEVSDSFTLFYQDEFNVMYPANNCVYEGYIRNNGDMYNSKDGCSLCRCSDGKSICEEESSC